MGRKKSINFRELAGRLSVVSGKISSESTLVCSFVRNLVNTVPEGEQVFTPINEG